MPTITAPPTTRTRSTTKGWSRWSTSADVIDQVAPSPRQEYVKAADAHSMHMGSSSGGTTVTLGVIPDYSAAMDEAAA